MDPIKQLAEELDRDRARREAMMTPEEKRRSDEYLEHLSCRIAMCGIRSQFPDADEERVRAIFDEREVILARLRASRQSGDEQKARH
jgi:hypothetical protein